MVLRGGGVGRGRLATAKKGQQSILRALVSSGGAVARARRPDPQEPWDCQRAKWTDLCVDNENLRAENSLDIGQCFGWKRLADDCWVGAVHDQAVAIKTCESTTLFCHIAGSRQEQEVKDMLGNFFQLSKPLAPLYVEWANADTRMEEVTRLIPGVRVVRQEPLECLISFICSSNNNIGRITLMLDKLRTKYGKQIAEVKHGQEKEVKKELATLKIFSFPTLSELATATEDDLRQMGFGYRAKYIIESVQILQEKGGEAWLHGLRLQSRDIVQQELCELSGVGKKVADCVALFSLDQCDCIPVDVHVWRIACRDFDSALRNSKSVTPKVYEQVGNLFRDRYGSHAGWAHSILFAAELPPFKSRLSKATQAEMDSFLDQEREEKAEVRKAKRARSSPKDEPKSVHK